MGRHKEPATVLIMGFTVTLAAVILILAQGFTESMQDSVIFETCYNDELRRAPLNPAYDECFNGSMNMTCVRNLTYNKLPKSNELVDHGNYQKEEHK